MLSYFKIFFAALFLILVAPTEQVYSFSNLAITECYLIDRKFFKLQKKEQQNRASKIVKLCLDEESKSSFYYIQFMNKTDLKKIFKNLNKDQIRLINITNGIDYNFFDKFEIKSGFTYDHYKNVINQNKIEFEKLINKYEIDNLPDRCINLDNNDNCYGILRKFIDLPKIGYIYSNIRSL